RPTQAGGSRCLQVLVDGALGDQTTASNLLLFEPERMKSENFFELSHAEPRLWQSDSSTFQWKPPPAQLAELFLMNRFRSADCRSGGAPILIDIDSERLST